MNPPWRRPERDSIDQPIIAGASGGMILGILAVVACHVEGLRALPVERVVTPSIISVSASCTSRWRCYASCAASLTRS
jgi:hypothetical protein